MNAENTPAAAELRAAADELRRAGETAARPGRDPVNLPMIRSWLEAMGDANPAYERDGTAPPAMIQVWTMRGLAPPSTGDPLQAMSDLCERSGLAGVVATDSAQTYHRYLRAGEEVTVRSRLESVAGPKRTAL
ncbi:FAS1-like dehydratase domain-containing protein, partial [Actinoplanes philippinensis]|uniref:FAS1-like dehydratase domain-containing protein n=1 Tax=Actinoplanes philippinensis TaxID=35752 RepID=UPI0033C9FFBB